MKEVYDELLRENEFGTDMTDAVDKCVDGGDTFFVSRFNLLMV